VSGLESRIQRVNTQIAEAAIRAKRAPESVTLVAVSKTVERDVVDEAYNLGLRHFGENRVPDVAEKYRNPLPSNATLHMIGQLQTNKVRSAAGLFGIIESVDRLSLIEELQKQAEKLDRSIPILLQVNVAGEEQKAGCDPLDVDALVAEILARSRLELRGLMTMAPLFTDPEDARPVFRGLRELRQRLLAALPGLTLPTLSMGMSNDFEVAIEEGATHVRLGRALFEG
jgi:pyridoxal phosphate enzyme (YggS family)